jgi:hypothetical protein
LINCAFSKDIDYEELKKRERFEMVEFPEAFFHGETEERKAIEIDEGNIT